MSTFITANLRGCTIVYYPMTGKVTVNDVASTHPNHPKGRYNIYLPDRTYVDAMRFVYNITKGELPYDVDTYPIDGALDNLRIENIGTRSVRYKKTDFRRVTKQDKQIYLARLS